MSETKKQIDSNPSDKSEACYHCGEQTIINPVYHDDKRFCCTGCKTVYSLLKEHHLDTYYDLEDTPGYSLKNVNISPQSYVVLDAPDIIDKLLSFKTDTTAKVTLRLPQIHCSSCLWLLENLYKMQPGIIASRVNFIKKEAIVTYNPQVMSLREVAQLLAAVGYPPELNLGVIDGDTKSNLESKRMLYRLGVAGFAFGNIMLMSFPDYLNVSYNKNDEVLKVFPYLNFALATPMVFYSGWGYLSSAWAGIRSRFLNMDVPIALGFLALYFRSVYETFSGVGSGYYDSLAGLIFFLLIGKWFQDKTYQRITFDRDYKSYFPIWANKLIGGREKPISLSQLEEDDEILVRNGEMIPADGTIIKGVGLIDYSFVSGEAEPIKAVEGEKVFAGGSQMGPSVVVKLMTAVSQSYLTDLWNDEAFTKEQNRPVSELSDVVGRRFTYVVMTIALVTLAYWMTRDFGLAFFAFTSVLIVACPCAISLSIPFTLGNVLSALGKKDIYLKNTQVIEDLAQIDHIVFDKTGTLTEKGINFSEETSLSAYQNRLIKTLVLQSNHPISQLLQKNIEEPPFGQIDDYQEIPGSGIQGIVDGHLVSVRAGAFEGENSGTVIKIDENTVASFTAQDRLRPGLSDLFDSLRDSYQLSLISGDNASSEHLIRTLFGDSSKLLFDQKPKQKLDYIRQLKEGGSRVLMIGDGLNDAGALKSADVGMVVTESSNNFTPASDVILPVRFFSRLGDILTVSKKSVKIIYKGYTVALIYNIVGLSFAIRALLSPVIAAILMPLSSITVVLIGVILSTLLVKKAGFDRK